MKSKIGNSLLILFYILHFTKSQNIEYSYEYYDDEEYYDDDELLEICSDKPKDEFIPSPRGEKYYIWCDDDIARSYEAKCPKETPIFRDGACDPLPETTTIETETTTEEIEEETEEPETTETTTTKKPTTKSTITTTSKTTTTTKRTTSKTPNTSIEPTEKCPEEDNPDKIIYISSKSSCSQYFICYHGKPLSIICAKKLHFNPNINKCDFPENAKCKIDEPEKPTPKCRSNTDIEFYEHPDNCSYFYFCTQGKIFIQQCSYLHHWDNESKKCIRKHLSKCIDVKKK